MSHYANVPQEWLEIIALYILMTWVYDRFTAVPYLRFLGEPGTGKTRLLQICAAISYKGVLVSGNITGPALFRTIDLVRGTMAVDEADFKNSQEWSDIVKVLNNGYTVGTPVIRCGPGDFTPQAFHVYGPKIISTRSRFEDEALESRCITFETSEGPLPKHIPLQLPLSFEREAVTLRNRLLRWRFDNFHHIQAREAEMRDLFPRCGQVGASLAGVAMSASDEHLRRLVSFLSNYDVDQKEASSKGIVRQALANLHESGGASATVGEVADAANAIANSLGSDTLTPKRVGGILRSLGMVPRKKKNGYVVDLVDPKG